MDHVSRHRCLIYGGSPSRYLPAFAAEMRGQLRAGKRCLYLNTPPMVAGMGSYLAAAGVEVAHEVSKSSLILSSDRKHLIGMHFDVDRMVDMLEDAIAQALKDGYKGLWASGDMSWEVGPEQDFSKLVEYEWRLEEVFLKCPLLSGVCQYHSDTLPKKAVRDGLVAHPSIFVNETLSRINPYYSGSAAAKTLPPDADLETIVARLSGPEN